MHLISVGYFIQSGNQNAVDIWNIEDQAFEPKTCLPTKFAFFHCLPGGLYKPFFSTTQSLQ